MQRRYSALQILSLVYKVIAALLFVAGVVLGGFTLITPTFTIDYSSLETKIIPAPPAVGEGIGLIVGSIIFALSLYAFGEILSLFIDLELNTRETAEYLSRMRGGSSKPATAPQLAKRKAAGDVPEPDM